MTTLASKYNSTLQPRRSKSILT